MYFRSVRLILKSNCMSLVKSSKLCDDAFKKRGKSFEENYVRKLTYEQLKQLRETVKGERKKKIQDELNRRKNNQDKSNEENGESQ